ncbi:MAG: response regulator transcription factor [Campylobacteraceae bacterium]|jgi:DNA-binding response OmpR family regulator|nr:response regulator transcription factor [Campylobacteraceae bacterium]MBT3883023.1 response regulator transcription factor [Campylobacteraceae bacterium]MBT4030683.1 response regulator transcription factor [Campylobacteraceae bacterium]MBT4179366.1 response regulator transcription factor [Campylobacteraceae bacterium]MBT4572654.1 response regulator transcription factor [Campylobacteraceae bacterium]
MKVLIVEDDIKISAFLEKGLTEEKYIVDCCFDGQEAFYLITTNTYDLIILDLMIPYIDGITLCKDLKEIKNSTPIIMLSAKSSIEDKILGLNSGANDYLAKPFSFDELMARIKVQLRDNETLTNILQIDNLKLDCDKKLATRDEMTIKLSSKEYILLEYLLRNKEKVLTEDMINNALWNMDDQNASNIISVYIYRLRKKIDINNNVKLIYTVRGMGYKISINKNA